MYQRITHFLIVTFKRFSVLICLLIFFVQQPNIFAATVKKVNTKKGTLTLSISPEDTIEVENIVCIYNENDKKIDCGTVTKIKGKIATLKMKSRKKIKKIRPDMSARRDDIAEGGELTDEGGTAENKNSMGLQGRYLYSVSTPSSSNKVGYLVPTSSPTSLWKPEGAVSSSLLGLSLAFAIPISKLSIIPGIRYRKIATSEVLSDYVADRRDPYISSTAAVQNLGIYLDLQFLRLPIGKIATFNLASGLDVDASTVTFKANKLDDTGATPKIEIASATSKLTVISLRIVTGVDLMFGKSFGLFFGSNLLAPLAATGGQFSGELAENEQKGITDPGEDLKKSLDHKKNSFGLELSIGPNVYF